MTQVVPTRPAALTALAPPPATPLTKTMASPCQSPASHRSPTELSKVPRDKDCCAQQQRERMTAAPRRKDQQRRLPAEENRQRRQQQQEAEKVRGHFESFAFID